MRKLSLYFFFLLLCTLHTSVRAQSVRNYYFTHYAAGAGLISNEINCVLQDTDGYIWTGSPSGLQRFDGTRFKLFKNIPGDSSSLPSNNVLHLMLDLKNNLWVLTGEGRVGIFDTKTFRFHEAKVKVKKPETVYTSIKRLIKDEYGNIFLLFGGNDILTWNSAKNEFSYEYNFFRLPPGTTPADFVQQPGTYKYWISVQGGGIAIYNKLTGKLNYSGNNPENEYVVERLSNPGRGYNFHFDKKGRCWFQVWGEGYPEIYLFDPSNKEKEITKFSLINRLQTYFETAPFYEQQDGSIWVTGLGVFARYIEKEKEFQLVYNGYLNERSISFERINSIYEDHEKNIWVATSNNGLYRFNPSEQYFTNVPHMNRLHNTKGHGTVMSLISARNGILYAGTWGDGFFEYDKNLDLLPVSARSGSHAMNITSAWSFFASGDSNTIWVGSQPGIYSIDQANNSSAWYNPPLLDNRTVRQVVEDKKGNLWLGMQNYGVFKWDVADKNARRDNLIRRYEKIAVTQVNKLCADRKGNVWVGTATKGLYVIDPVSEDTVMHFSAEGHGSKHIPENGISCLLDYDDSSMIITTSKHVMIYNRYKDMLQVIGKPDFLPGSISSLERDKKGYLWVSTTDGIYRVNLQNRVFVRFNREDGIDNDRFCLSSSAVLSDGRLAFGSSDQFIVFDPLAIDLNSYVPAAVITDFRVMNISLSVDSIMQLSQVVLRYDKNSLQIDFSPMVYNSAALIAYKLEGMDKEWRIADKNNTAIYSYLPPGHYNFQLKTFDAEKKATGTVISVRIRVNPPFWKAWWFYSLLILLAGLLLFWFDRERMKRKETVQKMRSTIADNLHNEVNTALHNINILSEMARLKADKDPEKSKEYIEQIHTRSQSMIIAMDDMLWSLDPMNDGMTKTTERMSEYIEALKNRHGVNIDIAVDKKVETLELNMKLRHDAFLMFKEGIKNLVMLGADNCHVYIRSDKGDLLFTTLFDSDKCNMQQLHNLLNRQDLENRLKAMKAVLELDLHKNHSAISLRVPVG